MLINLRNALMSGKRLPYDAELEYLQSTGTQWIDIDASKVATASRYVCSGQYMVGSNQAMIWSHGYRGVRVYGAKIGFVTGRYQTADTTVSFNVQCTSHFDASTLKGILYSGDGTELANVDLGTSSASGVLRLFAASPTATGYVASSSRISTMQVYDSSGDILLDLIPVRKGTVGYMYDRVSGELFGNAGTGDFVLGPDVVPVEYIESHGTEWIDTGIHLSRTLGAEMVCALNQYDGIPLGINYQNVRFYAPYVYSATQIGYGYGNFITKQATVPLGQVVKSSINFNASQQVSIAGIVDALPTPPSGSYSARTIAAFGFYGYASGVDSARPAKVRMYSINMSDGTSPIRKFLPVRVGTDATSWEGAMMDVLTRRIYRNQGTGAFAYGNDLKYPIPAA